MDIINVAHAGVISDAPSISTVAMNVLNFLLQCTGIIAIISLVVAGVIYLTNGGSESRIRIAKSAMQASVLGLLISMGGMILIVFLGKFLQG